MKLGIGLLLGAMAMTTGPVQAKPDHASENERHDDRRGNDHQREDISNHNGSDHADWRAGDNRRHDYRGRHRGWQKRAVWQEYYRYNYNQFDPRYGNYQASRYYRDGSYYQDRRLTYQDRIFRGSDGRYYCRRNDGTTGLIIGALGGGLLGNAIAPNGSKTLGAILGGVGGALIGRSIGRDGVQCN